MTTMSQILEGLTDAFTSTGTLSRILQSAENPSSEMAVGQDEDDSEYEYSEEEELVEEGKKEPDGDILMGDGAAGAQQERKKRRNKGPKLEKVLEDDDFIPELRLKNELLLKYLTIERMEKMMDFVTIEPNLLTDTPQRCYKLPFQATETFCTDNDHIKKALFPDEPDPDYRLLSRLFSFITSPHMPVHATRSAASNTLNHTLGGYFNKIVSFWLIKETRKMLEFLMNQRFIVATMFETHLFGLSSCVTDLIVRFCTVRDIHGMDTAKYRQLRSEILQHCINCLEQNSDDDFVTEQVFEILTSIVRRCYQMHGAREFFDQLMSPFILQPILQFTFTNYHAGQASGLQLASKQGCAFLRVLFFNMFIAEPHAAMQDVMEMNFGFQVESVAGVSVDQIKKGGETKGSETANQESTSTTSSESSKEEKKVPAADTSSSSPSEFQAMKQEELMKAKLLSGVERIYEQHEVNPLLAQQIVTFLPRYEQLFAPQQTHGLQVGTRVKLYELLETLIDLDNLIVNIAIKDRKFAEFVMEDYEKYEANSQVLNQLNRVILAITKQTACYDMKVRLFKGPSSLQQPLEADSTSTQSQQLLFRLAKRLSLSAYGESQARRKDIYAYIHLLVKELLVACEQQNAVKKLLGDCEPNWTALRKALEEEERSVAQPWGERQIPAQVSLPAGRAPDVVRKHDEQQTGINLSDKGAASTTKKIVQSSVERRKKMMMFDDALK